MSIHRSFWGDERGAAAPLFALGLIGLVATGGLAWDISRGYALRGELDAAADAAALAGATQLDGKTGAQTRAIAAVQGGLVRNSQRLADISQTNVTASSGVTIAFLKSLSPRAAATSDADSNFVQVDVKPRQLGFVYGAFAGVTGAQVVAHAVAGYGAGVCKIPPLMICNPDETTSLTFNADAKRGQAIQLTGAPGGNKAWGPGNFGFLSVGSGGANVLREALARNPPLAECFGKMAETEPGNMDNTRAWINMRFDIYVKGSANASSKSNDPYYPPALNTIVGTKTKTNASCDVTPPAPLNTCSDTAAVANGMGLPIDCGQTGIFGNATWNSGKYFATNHSGINPNTYVPATPSYPEFAGSGWAAYGPTGTGTVPTRFQVYNWELAQLNSAGGNGRPSTPMVGFSGGQAASTGTADFARPMCNTSSPAPAAPDRRTISAIVVNCKADGVKGRSTVNIISYVDLFLIAPAVDDKLYGEVIGVTTNVSAVGKETRKFSVRLYE